MLCFRFLALLELAFQVIKPIEDTTVRSYRQEGEHWNVRRSTARTGTYYSPPSKGDVADGQTECTFPLSGSRNLLELTTA